MFQFAGFPSYRLCIHLLIPKHYFRQVSPFGYLRLFGYLLLGAAFRSLSRPSSAPSAKAFTLCPSLLDLLLVTHILSYIFLFDLLIFSLDETFCIRSFDLFASTFAFAFAFAFSISFLLLFFGFLLLDCLCSLAFSGLTFFRLMVGLGGLEPPTSRLSGVRSNHLSYKPMIPEKILIA